MGTNLAAVGRIARAHGNHGQVIVDPDTDFLRERFRPGAAFIVEQDGRPESLVVVDVRFQHDRPILTLAGVDTIDAAEQLAGRELLVPVEELTPLPAGTFYRHDLVGCGVETTDGERVGVVSSVEGSMASSRLVVESANGEVLVPLVSDICRVIDPAGKRIVIDPPDGLLDLNR